MGRGVRTALGWLAWDTAVEDLLEGAKRCLLAKGFVRTTARDIVVVGTNLASIGYHYGSKDALLVEAFVVLVEPMGESFTAPARGTRGRAASRVLSGGVDEHPPLGPRSLRPLWMITLEVITRVSVSRASANCWPRPRGGGAAGSPP
ncbi:hypothetical protein SALBM135S_06103 [Streptomyces alboniger]